MGITERIDAITHIPEVYRGTIIPAPRSVKIELTGRCNFSCAYCARSDKLREQQDMDRKLYERLVLEFVEAGVEELGVFYLGESFMCEWLPDAIRFAKEAGIKYVFLTTNGSLCTSERVEACMVAGLDSLKFSCNYADAAQMHQIAKVKPTIFSNVYNNIVAARATRDIGGYKCGLYASYIRYDGQQGVKMKGFAEAVAKYVDEVYALPLYSQADFAADKEEGMGWNPEGGNSGRADNPVAKVPCWAIFTEGHVTWDGKLSACCFDHADKFTMGDLMETSFMDAWNSDKFQALRSAHLAKEVRGTVCAPCLIA